MLKTDFANWSGAKVRKSCRSRKTLKNALSLAIRGANFVGVVLRFYQIFIIKILLKFYLNFSKIGTSDGERGRIFQRFSRSTRFSHFFQKILKMLLNFLRFSENSGGFYENSKIFSKILIIFWKKCENRVDLGKRGKMRPLSLSEVPILLKFD